MNKTSIRTKKKSNTNTDFDAPIMQFSDRTCRLAYSEEVAIDGEENVIMVCYLTDEAIDHQQLQFLMEHALSNSIHPRNLGADAGFFSYDQAAYLE